MEGKTKTKSVLLNIPEDLLREIDKEKKKEKRNRTSLIVWILSEHVRKRDEKRRKLTNYGI